MTTIVRFRTGAGQYAAPVEMAREVRTTAGLVALPGAAEGLVGLLPRASDELPVLACLGAGDSFVLVLDDGDRAFGLLVEDVSGVVTVPADAVGPAPLGQHDGLISGVVRIGAELILLVDVAALARRLSA